jgi:hypothetical protein
MLDPSIFNTQVMYLVHVRKLNTQKYFTNMLVGLHRNYLSWLLISIHLFLSKHMSSI